MAELEKLEINTKQNIQYCNDVIRKIESDYKKGFTTEREYLNDLNNFKGRLWAYNDLLQLINNLKTK